MDTNEFEICVLCGCQTDVLKSTNIALRFGYVDGAGQLCEDCAEYAQYDCTFSE